MKRVIPTLALLATSLSAVAANNIDTLGNLNQSQFRLLAEDLGSALSYKALRPAESYGITGFDIGLEVTSTKLSNADVFGAASSGGSLSSLPLPKLHAHKGLIAGLDVGLSYASAPNSNITLTGGEVSYAVMDGNVALPAVGVRLAFSSLGGVDQLAVETRSLEFSISKGLAMLTPYAGVGKVWVTATPQGSVATVFKEEKFSQSKVFAGVRFSLGLMDLTAEMDSTGSDNTYSGKLSIGF